MAHMRRAQRAAHLALGQQQKKVQRQPLAPGCHGQGATLWHPGPVGSQAKRRGRTAAELRRGDPVRCAAGARRPCAPAISCEGSARPRPPLGLHMPCVAPSELSHAAAPKADRILQALSEACVDQGRGLLHCSRCEARAIRGRSRASASRRPAVCAARAAARQALASPKSNALLHRSFCADLRKKQPQID